MKWTNKCYLVLCFFLQIHNLMKDNATAVEALTMLCTADDIFVVPTNLTEAFDKARTAICSLDYALLYDQLLKELGLNEVNCVV